MAQRRAEVRRRAPGITPVVALVVLAGAVALAYANALRTGLPLDAAPLVLGNPALRALTWDNVRTLFTSDYWAPFGTNGLYRPLTTFSFLVDWTVLGYGQRPTGYHATNLVLHYGCAAAMFALLGRAGLSVRPALLASLLFAVHPATTEVVTNVAGRADLLATLAVLIGLLCHAHAGAAAGRARVLWSAGLVVSGLVGAFAKENAIVLVALVVAWDAAFARPPVRPWTLARGPLLLAPVVALMLGARWAVQRAGWPVETSTLDNPLLAADFWAARLTAVKVLGQQLGTLVAPVWLSADYSADQIPVVATPDWQVVAGAIAVIALLAGTVAAWRTDRTLGFLLVFFLVTLLPTANLLVLIGSVRADRFLYLPLVGFAGALVHLAWGRAPDDAPAAARRRQAVTVAVAVLAVLFGLRTMRRNADWTDDLTLWTATVAASPRSAKAHNGVAEALFARQRPEDLDRVIAHAERATAIRTDYLPGLVNLASYYGAKGDALAAAGGDATPWYRRSLAVLVRARALDRAVGRRFRQAMRARGTPSAEIPDYGNRLLAQHLLVARARLGQWHGAIAAARRLQQLDPWDPRPYVDLAAAFAHLERWDDATVQLFEAMTLAPSDVDVQQRLLEAYRRLGADATVLRADGPGRVRLELESPMVRAHRCRALTEQAALFEDAALPGMAKRLRTTAASVCPGSPAR